MTPLQNYTRYSHLIKEAVDRFPNASQIHPLKGLSVSTLHLYFRQAFYFIHENTEIPVDFDRNSMAIMRAQWGMAINHAEGTLYFGPKRHGRHKHNSAAIELPPAAIVPFVDCSAHRSIFPALALLRSLSIIEGTVQIHNVTQAQIEQVQNEYDVAILPVSDGVYQIS